MQENSEKLEFFNIFIQSISYSYHSRFLVVVEKFFEGYLIVDCARVLVIALLVCSKVLDLCSQWSQNLRRVHEF